MAASTSNLRVVDDTPMTVKFWDNSKYERTHVLYAPFVVSLIAGTLKLDAFLHFVVQDIHILRAFEHVYHLAEEYTYDDDAKVEICALLKSVNEQIKLYHSFLQTMPDKDITPSAATIKYIGFLLPNDYGKSPGNLDLTPFEKTKLAAYIVSSMTPHMRLYAFLGKEIQSVLDPSKGIIHPYQKWIDNISSDTFQAQAMQTEELLEKLSVSLTGNELRIVEKLYYEAMDLEVEFFLAPPLLRKTAIVPMCQGPNPAGLGFELFCSFDLTCTVVDSSAVFAELSVLKAAQSDQANMRKIWNGISNLYTEEYVRCIESILIGDKAEKFSYKGLGKASRAISAFEKNANLRVTRFQLLKGLRADDIKRAGELMKLQDGCIDFFHRALDDERLNTNIHVISYCWSDAMIESALSSGGLVDTVGVHANQLIYKNNIATGKVSWKIQSPIDKAKTVGRILESYGTDKKYLTVYIGDTVGDFLCLLGADYGIVIGSSWSLRSLGAHFGVTFLPLFPYVIEEQERVFHKKPPVGRKILFTVSSWAEIHAFFLGF